jgi:branched-chain amino acid transport system substrate-binding protein
MGGYGTNSLLAVMPLIIERRRFFVGLMGLGVNKTFGYDGYFAMIPTGPEPSSALTEGFFALASAQVPKPTTIALLSADAEFSRNPVAGAQVNAEKFGLKIVQNTTYALSTRDFLPLIDAVSKSECDVLFLCSYLADTVGLVRAIRTHRFRPKMVGGAMIGPQNADVKLALGPLLNGFVNYEYWVPTSKMMFRGVHDLLANYQARAAEAHVDLLGHYMVPLAYAQMQVLAQAIEGTGGFDDAMLAKFSRDASFDTVMGPVRFGANGEWTEPRVLQVQFTGISEHDVDQFRDESRQIVVSPGSFASGTVLYPYEKAL